MRHAQRATLDFDFLHQATHPRGPGTAAHPRAEFPCGGRYLKRGEVDGACRAPLLLQLVRIHEWTPMENPARRTLQGQVFEQLGLTRAVRTRNHAEALDPRHSVSSSARFWASFGDRRSPAHGFASSIRGDADEHALFQDVARQSFFRETLTDLPRRGRQRSIKGLQSEFTSDGSRHGEWIIRRQRVCQQRSSDRRLDGAQGRGAQGGFDLVPRAKRCAPRDAGTRGGCARSAARHGRGVAGRFPGR